MGQRRAAFALALLVACGPGSAQPPSPTAPVPATSVPSSSPSTVLADVPPLHPSVDGYPETSVQFSNGTVALAIPVKLAATAADRTHGLMEVPVVPDGTGMLFVFAAERTGGFWMKNTLARLDIAFTGADGVIGAVLTMEPCTSDPCPVYSPGTSYTSALEVPAGWFARNDIAVGTRLTFDLPPGTEVAP